MIQRSTSARRLPRARLALLLAAAIAAPSAVVPPAAAAAAPSPAAGARVVRAAEKARDQQAPSIHYQHALEHAADATEFEPGEVVTVPFTPSRNDAWKVDGKPPKALPAGRASGREMRDAARADWAKGARRDLAGDDAGTGHDAGTGDDAADPAAARGPETVEPASFEVTPSGEISAGAAVGPNSLRREVFGFLPYWELTDADTTLDWRTLSTVAYFSVGCLGNGKLDKVDPDGTFTTGWGGWTSSKMTSVINAAHQNHARVVLTISCFAWSSGGATRQANLLGSSTARATLAKAAAAAIRDRGADGINLDFEPIVAGYADEFTALVRSVRTELNRIAPGYQLTFDALGSIGNQPIVNATAPGGADAVFVMGYDYRTDSSSIAGSIAPLAGPRYDLTDTVKAYIAKIPPSKVILGVPYYGRAWSTSSDKPNASTLPGAKYGYPAAPTYGQAMDFVNQHGRRYDSIEQSPWTAYRKQTCTTTYGCVTAWRELYYDDPASLRLKYDLVNRSSLRGAGIWALGFDGTRPELRTALADKFLADKTAPVVGVATLAQSQRDEGFRVAWTAWDDSTIRKYNVQVSVDGGTWTGWLTATTLLSSIYLGADGHTYAFRVSAVDAHGNVSPWYSATSAAQTGVPADLQVGGFATVLVDGLRMRSAPTTDGAVMTTLAEGDALRVIGGPTVAEGYTWFQVSGPVRQWAPVDAMQVGGWVAAHGNGATNAGPRRPVYATRVDAGITHVRLNGGGPRVLTPDGADATDRLRITWTNQRAFDSLALRVHRTDGTFMGSVGLGATSAGPHVFDWDGRLGGEKVAAGAYVVQLQGIDGSATFNAPSASPVSAQQVARFGVTIGPAVHTSVQSFASTPGSPTRASKLTYKIVFGGPVSGLGHGDIVRNGTATGCTVAAPTGSGTTWSVVLTGCGKGSVVLRVKAGAVVDAVGNVGPAAIASAPTVVIDRTAPTSTAPRVLLRSGVSLASGSTGSPLIANLTWKGTDTGGAGVKSYDVAVSRDGGAYQTLAAGVTPAWLNVTLPPGPSYRFRVRVRDAAGNVGAWATGPSIRGALRQQTYAGITWKGAWGTVQRAGSSGGSSRYSATPSSGATFSFTGRSIAWVSTFAPNNGVARVFIDGVLVAAVDTHADTMQLRRVAYARTWSTSGSHTIRVVVMGTAGRPWVEVDAFEVVR